MYASASSLDHKELLDLSVMFVTPTQHAALA